MNERERQASDQPGSADLRSQWTRPEVDRLMAGAAEATDGADADGATLS